MPGPPALVLSCEHGGRRVPAPWRRLFAGAQDVLGSHRGWDPGALDLARRLARRLDAPLVATTVTRLLVDANRSEGHPRVFSSWTRALPGPEKIRILDRHHRAHRAEVEAAVRREMERSGAVLHLGVHSFTPVLRGRRRDVDLGVLYDPSRAPERARARALIRSLRRELPTLRVRANQPYRGVSDGLTTTLRKRLPPERYAGLELEVGQSLLASTHTLPTSIVRGVGTALAHVLAPPEAG